MVDPKYRPLFLAAACIAAIAIFFGKSLMALGWTQVSTKATLLEEGSYKTPGRFGVSRRGYYVVRLHYSHEGHSYTHDITTDTFPYRAFIRVNPRNPRQISHRDVNWLGVGSLGLLALASIVYVLFAMMPPKPKPVSLIKKRRRFRRR